MKEFQSKQVEQEDLTKEQENLALQLYKVGVVKLGEFRLKIHEKYPQAPLSLIYFDFRLLRRFPEAKSKTVDVYEELLKPLYFDLLADVPTAATPLVSSLSDRLKIGMITPRMDKKTYGLKMSVDGLTEGDKGKTVVLLDDLVTGANSKMEAVKILGENGLVVKDIVVIIDREQVGKEDLKKNGLSLHAAMTVSQILDYYVHLEIIDPNQRKRIGENISKLYDFLSSV